MLAIKMKLHYIVLLLFLCSCNQTLRETESTLVSIKDTTAVVEESAANRIDEEKTTGANFKEEFEKLPLRKIPLVDTTSFDSFIDEDDIRPINPETFSLPIIYKNWYQEGYNYKAISGSRVELSELFLTAIITIKKGDSEMENRLINFDPDGNYIDSLVIAYDEIAEGLSRILSRIGHSFIRVDHIFWNEIKEVTQVVYTITSDGAFEEIDSTNFYQSIEDYTLINSILMDLNLEWAQIEYGYLIVEELSQITLETLVIIPEIVEEQDDVLALNTHIVLVHPITGSITHTLFETYKSNGWFSDAVGIEEITIDPLVYRVSRTTKAFGVLIKYRTSSQPNPYAQEVISLYVKENDSLKKIVENYTMYESVGAVNINPGACAGEFTIEKNKLSIVSSETNNYFDIQVTTSNIQRILIEDENGECQTQETITNQTTLLQFNGEHYEGIE